jgi:hypothetical protein
LQWADPAFERRMPRHRGPGILRTGGWGTHEILLTLLGRFLNIKSRLLEEFGFVNPCD